MTEKKLTPRQREALTAIWEFISQNKQAPTLKELKAALHVKSYQSITDWLDILESRGYIVRETGKIRGLSITPKAESLLGLKIDFTNTRGGATISSFNPDQNQAKILKELIDIDPRLGDMYVGAMQTLQDKTKFDRVAQSAHSLREITKAISDRGKELQTELDKQEIKKNVSANMIQLERIYDPIGRPSSYVGVSVYSIWNELNVYFVNVAHHRVKNLTEEDYLKKVEEYEEFLVKYIFPHQAEIYDNIDKILLGNPANQNPKEIENLFGRNIETYRYFFRNADEKWLDFLARENFLKCTWETGEYFKKIAKIVPEKVSKLITDFQIVKKNSFIENNFVQAACEMPPQFIKPIINKIKDEGWLKYDKTQLLQHYCTDLFKKLITSSSYDNAVFIAELLLTPQVDENRRLGGVMETYNYEELLKVIASLDIQEIELFLKIQIKILGGLEEFFNNTYAYYSLHDSSGFAFSRNTVDEMLVRYTASMLEKYTLHLVKINAENINKKIEEVFQTSIDHKVQILLRMHLYHTFPAVFKKEIKEILTKRIDNAHEQEYEFLLNKTFGDFNKSYKKNYLKQVIERVGEGKEAETIKNWKIWRLSLIKQHLSVEQMALYKELLNGHPDPNPLDDTPRIRTFTGPTSPLSKTWILNEPIDSLIKKFTEWIPNKGFAEPTRLGLARQLAAAVEEKTEFFSDNAEKFNNENLYPVYVYEFFLGLREGLKKGKAINWPPIIVLLGSLVKKAKEGRLNEFINDSEDESETIDWGNAFQWGMSLIHAGLYEKKYPISFDLRPKVWEIINFLVEHPDPDLAGEDKFGGEKRDLYTLSINTVRGEAFHALFAYIFWCDRNLETTKAKERIVPEAKKVILDHLNHQHEPGLMVSAVIGKYFPWLCVYEEEWSKEITKLIFPLEDAERRYAAWEGYLAEGVFEQALDILEPQYRQSIKEIKLKHKKESRLDVVERLGEHLAIAYVCKIGKMNEELLNDFFSTSTVENCGKLISFIGRAFIHGDVQSGEIELRTERLKEVWGQRLKRNDNEAELIEFGWWFKKGKFEDEWLLAKLKETLQKTHGVIESEYHVFQSLTLFASLYPLAVLEIISLVIKGVRAGGHQSKLYLYAKNEIRKIISDLKINGDKEVMVLRDKIIDNLIKLGHEEYRTLR